ncbi:ribbon-helix-helix domain-containing protein [Polaromonas naphthalenivorans]|uniref:ribbon-helix-helix domain-containing protein n=1 Tax=Polaromonas naphthalenivorans TaxID=216465 RepID=UPI0018DE7923|nr:ribbon-helix-helix domain-containing protein [Polaromonas naphthalenivorans]
MPAEAPAPWVHLNFSLYQFERKTPAFRPEMDSVDGEAVPVFGLHLNPVVVHDECTKRTNIYLTEPSVAKLQELSKQTGLCVAELIRRAIDDFLNKKK